MKKLLLPLLIAAALSGCASFPENYEKPTRANDVAAEMQDVWSSIPAITRVTSKTGITIKKFNDVPNHVRSRHINLKIENGQGLAIADVAAALRAQGVRVTSTLKDSDKHEIVNSFTGDLGLFLDQLTVEHNIAYEYRNDVLFLTESSRYVVTLPQHEDFLKEVTKSVIEMGGTAVRGDVRSSRLYFQAKPDVAPMLEEYIGHIAANAAMLKMQVAVITVRLTRDFNLGLDWANLQAGAGRGQLAPGITPIFPKEPTTTVPGTTGTGTGVGTAAVATAAETAIKLGQVLGFSGGTGGTFTVANQAFSLTAAVKALSTYGNARTEQNVSMGTLNGLKVKIESGNDIPYVKKIGSATTSGGSTSGSSETDIVKSGLTVELTPYFDAEDKSVVSTMHVNMASLVGFRELPAGLNLGMMSLPEMQKLGFDNVGRLTVGETQVLGGITYDQLDNNYTNLPGLESAATGSKSEKTSRFAVYIVLRPTVTVFESEKLAPVPAAEQVQPVLPAAMPVPEPVITPVVAPEPAPVVAKPVKPKKRTTPAPGALTPASPPTAVPVGPAGAIKPAGLPQAVPVTKGAYVPAALAPVKPLPGVVEPGAKTVRPVAVAPSTPVNPVESK